MAQDPVTGTQPLKYMTVPEKIELTGHSGPVGYSTGQPSSDQSQRYKPMKIPDTITLGAGSSPPGGRDVTGEVGNGVERDSMVISEARKIREEDRRQLHSQPDDISREQVISQRNISASKGFSNLPNANVSDIERRLRTLENKVQRLTETVLNHQDNLRRAGSNDDSGGNGFWYVMTFAGWMMVPLIVVFMYRFKK